MTADELKLKLIDLGERDEVWCIDKNGIIFTLYKMDLYIGKLGFMHGDDRFFYGDYMITWAFTEEAIRSAGDQAAQKRELAESERKRVEAEAKVKKMERAAIPGNTVPVWGTTVYIVMVGAYSDRHVERVFLDKTAAYDFEERWNDQHRDKKGEVYYQDEAFVEEHTTPECETDAIEKLNRMFVEISYYPDDNKVYWHKPDQDEDGKAVPHLEEMTVGNNHEGKLSPIFSFCMLEKMMPKDNAVLLKVAQDRYAEYKAKVLGVT